ncbi:MAG: hypothetical protein NT157_06685 [Candidatus Micrarchaeota archaeon]|nr:hypothetical protein [Candidatus Micrarchaeota archaeon]
MVKKKGTDKWKTKQWYTLYAPPMFDSMEFGTVPTSEERSLVNRKISIALSELDGELSHSYISLKFRISEVKGKAAYTMLVGHEVSRGYLRTLVRRGRNIIYLVSDVETKDGVKVRCKLVAYTSFKVRGPARTAIRKELAAELAERSKEMNFQDLEQEFLFGRFSARAFKRVKKIAPTRRIEVMKTEVRG